MIEMLAYLTRVMSLQEALDLPLSIGFAMQAAIIDQDPMLSVRLGCDGYVAQESLLLEGK